MSVKGRSYKLLPKARQDLEAIWRYTFEAWSLQQANTYYKELIGCFPELAAGTARGRKVSGIKRDYLALASGYKDSAQTVTIIRILHRRMNIGAHL
ncbi:MULTISPECIES: type II toxin-antitoxin system RelE/ParE family toxin [Rhizobium]|uniref:Type II toxin-antitoxin system RelE/ParE family toxin n=1 Tax=Rhizobium tropici TaxID=398 RepID=A0A329YBW9_RHITR|nr:MULTISPECIES: type II toxin-antitoxin system RelE/ParE family toxin [Rhizobium]MBB3286595.1 toxin ParE1/3/4 [Rhizobium sp. BK252]MBB3401211.1 toxin ParE1/3/4 [Rhizobium sp. BK289]MBB3413789.1 toxin ParE1/3/4 [Rhizobium sp. BK284]MBB3481676.1 toxin ParE1/3/4 [Rhizobium sp. BK347]MDK4719731.1 type II toxin-antitoxin system RelE/ParE family toxin [Rhizobium sp. CNPSo 3968]